MEIYILEDLNHFKSSVKCNQITTVIVLPVIGLMAEPLHIIAHNHVPYCC